MFTSRTASNRAGEGGLISGRDYKRQFTVTDNNSLFFCFVCLFLFLFLFCFFQYFQPLRLQLVLNFILLGICLGLSGVHSHLYLHYLPVDRRILQGSQRSARHSQCYIRS